MIPLRRIQPYRGLVIDVPAWTEAHGYHTLQQIRHGLLMHSPGVIAGLDVTATDPPGSSVVIHPGVALDQEGHIIIVGHRQQISLQTETEDIIYLTLEYSEVPDEILVSPGSDEPRPRYLMEAYQVLEYRQPPEQSSMEIARIQVSGNGNPIANPRYPRMPQPDEIDLRHRIESGPRAVGEVALGVLSLEHVAEQMMTNGTTGADAMGHLPGIMNLINAINSTTGYRASFKGAYDLHRVIDDCQLLLMSGPRALHSNGTIRRLSENLP